MKENTAIIIMDNDLGFAFWLGRALDHAGYRALPARSVTDAAAVLAEVDMNLRLLILGGPQAGAEGLVALCRQKHRDVRIMRLREDNVPADRASRTDNECRKPAGRSAGNRMELLCTIYGLLASEPAA